MPIEVLTELQYGGGDDLFPLFAYEYNAQGYYSEPETIRDMAELDAYFKKNLKKILDEKRELRITDTGDLLCFHAQNGKILYDGEKHYPEGKPCGRRASQKEPPRIPGRELLIGEPRGLLRTREPAQGEYE